MSLSSNNLSYLYGLNTGQTLDGSLANYSDSTISAAGLKKYILQNKMSETWFNNLAVESFSAALKKVL